jgi:hypothetical protein
MPTLFEHADLRITEDEAFREAVPLREVPRWTWAGDEPEA